MKTKVLVHTIKITAQGEKNYFQIKIPSTAIMVIGIQLTSRLLSPNPFFMADKKDLILLPNAVVGEIKLQSNEEANVFFADDVVLEDANLNFGNFSKSVGWNAKAWTHGLKFTPVKCNIESETTFLSGFYQDRLGELIRKGVKYDIKIYVWYEEENT